jgi:hypothetical protein
MLGLEVGRQSRSGSLGFYVSKDVSKDVTMDVSKNISMGVQGVPDFGKEGVPGPVV